MPLHLGGADRRLPAPEQRVVAALGGEVVGDHEDRLAAEGELARQRLAAGCPRRVGRVDPAGGGGQVRPVAAASKTPVVAWSRAARAVDEGDPRSGPEEEDLADVAARLAAVGAVGRVDPARLVRRPAGGADRRRQLVDGLLGVDRAVVDGAVVVLDLLQRQDVRASCRLSTIWPASRVELVCGSPGSRFSTLKVATASSVGARLRGDLALQAAGCQGRRGGGPGCSCRSCSPGRRPSTGIRVADVGGRASPAGEQASSSCRRAVFGRSYPP